jgi:hypothetical protein
MTEIEAIVSRTADQAVRAGRPFKHLFCDDFYDGVETGIGVTESGAAFRFSAIGDSHFRVFRAFVIDAIEWQPTVGFDEKWPQFISAEDFTKTSATESHAAFVGIGTPYLEWLVAEPIDDPSVFLTTEATFCTAHRALKEKFARRGLGR